MDRLRNGRHNITNMSAILRVDALAFPEHLGSNAHLHVAANLGEPHPGRPADESFFVELERRWQQITGGRGQLHVVATREGAGWASYITKELRPRQGGLGRGEVEYFWSADFYPDRTAVESGQLNDILDALAPEKIAPQKSRPEKGPVAT